MEQNRISESFEDASNHRDRGAELKQKHEHDLRDKKIFGVIH